MTEKFLIIDDDLDTLRLVGLMLQKQGYQIAAAMNGEQGLRKVIDESPDLILLDVMMPDMDGYEVTRRLRKNPITAGIPILMFTAQSQLNDKVTGFEAGADDYLTKPTHPTELQAHVKALLSRSVKSDQIDPLDQQTITIGVLSARGGLGNSSLSLNLGNSLLSTTGEDTIVAEIKSGAGTIGRDLGFTDLNSLTNLLKNTPEEITRTKVEETLLKHESGLQLLLASEHPRDMVLSNAIAQSETIFSHINSLARFLIIDFGAGLPVLSQTLLPLCSQIIVIVEAVKNSIAHTKILREDLIAIGINPEKIIFILNHRMRSDKLLSHIQVQELLGFPIAVTLTPAPELFAQAIDQNTTAVLHDPEGTTHHQIKKLVDIIIENENKKR